MVCRTDPHRVRTTPRWTCSPSVRGTRGSRMDGQENLVVRAFVALLIVLLRLAFAVAPVPPEAFSISSSRIRAPVISQFSDLPRMGRFAVAIDIGHESRPHQDRRYTFHEAPYFDQSLVNYH